jgi:hypothetical protein
MLIDGDTLGGADRQRMAEPKQQPVRFTVVAPAHYTSATRPPFVSQNP